MSVEGKEEPAPATSSVLQFIIIAIGRRYLAFEAGFVNEVLTVEELERGKDSVGKGAIDRTVDLSMQLNLSDVPIRHDTPVVVLADERTQCSIRVNRVHGRLEIHPSQILPLPAHFKSVEREWYRGMILFEKSIALILNPTWVLGGLVVSSVGHEQGAARSLMDAWGSAAREGRAC